ncbi:hypothetical protein [Microbaculum marinum]|uniref:Uncharacterized protein n=1 Tax=Microbaculum marinum TaxID=1764581 RepID=A0AAW9RWS9_9HYPH
MASGRLGSLSSQLDSGPVSRAIELVGDSPELVALALLRQIAHIEGKSTAAVDRKWILETYSECLDVVRGGDADGGSGRAAKGRAAK